MTSMNLKVKEVSKNKEKVLLIGRGKSFEHYIQGMIDVFSKDYDVLLLELGKDIAYEGDYKRLALPELPDTAKDGFWSSIKKAEKDTALNLFSSYSNYLYYGRLAQEACIDYSSYWRSKDWIAAHYMQAYAFMQKMLAENIKFVFHDTIDLILLQMVEAFSVKYKFGFYHTLTKPGIYNNRVLLSYGIPRKSALVTKYLDEDITPTPEETKVIDEVVNKFKESKPTLSYLKNSSQQLVTINEIKKIFSHTRNIKFGLKRAVNRFYLQKKAKHFSISAAGKYILYFLHHQPEATTTSAASQYVDQWKIIEEIAIHGPSDVNIVIKAHPFGYGWQGKQYFERLLRLKNVMLAPIGFSGKELIQKAQAVLTINGSIGLEALIYDVPAYTLGDSWYSHPDYIQNLDDPKDLLRLIDAPEKINKDKKYKILAAAHRASVDFFVDFSHGYADEKRQSGQNLAQHILDNKNIYFNRVDV